MSDAAVWSVVLQRTPARVGSGGSRGRTGEADAGGRWVWRNNMFRNLGRELSSSLIIEATERTYEEWRRRYGELPGVRLRTEVRVGAVRSTNPGCCYLKAGWERGERRRGIQLLYAPPVINREDLVVRCGIAGLHAVLDAADRANRWLRHELLLQARLPGGSEYNGLTHGSGELEWRLPSEVAQVAVDPDEDLRPKDDEREPTEEALPPEPAAPEDQPDPGASQSPEPDANPHSDFAF